MSARAPCPRAISTSTSSTLRTRDAVVGHHAAVGAARRAAHQHAAEQQQHAGEQRRLDHPGHVRSTCSSCVEDHASSSSRSARARARATGSSAPSSGSSGASAGAFGSIAGRAAPRGEHAAGMISERPITRPTGCAPSASAAADRRSRAGRSAAPKSAGQPPPLLISPQNKSCAVAGAARGSSRPRAARRSARLSAKRGDTSAPASAAVAPAESARFRRHRSGCDRSSGPSAIRRRRLLRLGAFHRRRAGARGAARRRRSRCQAHEQERWVMCRSAVHPVADARSRSGSRRPPRAPP